MGRLKELGEKLIAMDRLGEEVERSLFEAQLQSVITELERHRGQMSVGALSRDTRFLSEERYIYKKGAVRENDEEVHTDLHRLALESVAEDFQRKYRILYSNMRAAFPSSPLSSEELEALKERGWRDVLVRSYLLTPEEELSDAQLVEKYKNAYAAFKLVRSKKTGELLLLRFYVVGEWT